MRRWYKKLCSFLALASRRRSSRRLAPREREGQSPSQKTPRQRARQFYERARQAVRYGALSARVARRLLRLKSAFRRKVRIGKLWFTSSTLGGWCFAVLLLAVVLGVGFLYLYPIPKDADILKALEPYAVIVIGLGSLYIAGTNFWEKRGSAFSVEYQTATDINTADFLISSSTSEEIIGNPANSTMPYVKRLYIRNEKNKHEAIKKILLQLPNKQTLVLKEYKKADALLIKPYEDKVLRLNSVTAYYKKIEYILWTTKVYPHGGRTSYILKNETMIRNGEIIIETAQGQAYIKNNKKAIVSYEKDETLIPRGSVFDKSNFDEGDLTHKLIFSFDVFLVVKVIINKIFVNNSIFYSELIKEFTRQRFAIPKFREREGAIKIQITFNTYKEVSLCYSFQANKKIYTFPVQEKLKGDFLRSYYKYDFKYSNFDDFANQFEVFFKNWKFEQWGKNENSIVDSSIYASNPLAIAGMKIKIIDDEKP